MGMLYEWVSGGGFLLPGENDFERGFYTALILAGLVLFLVIVLCLIAKLLFRKPAVPGVTLEREDGDIFISRNALSTAVFHLEDEFPGFEVLKVLLGHGRRGELELAVTVLFDEKSGAFDKISNSFKKRVFDILQHSFGIDSIKSVSIALSKLPNTPRRNDNNGSGKDNDVTSHAFVSGV